MKIDSLPIFSICGWSGSGKTTLIEELLPHLRGQGLKVVVIKHYSQKLNLDHAGKDSLRFFESKADIVLESQTEIFIRQHKLDFAIQLLANNYDLILIEGDKKNLFPKIWLSKKDEKKVPLEVSNIKKVLAWSENRVKSALEIILAFTKKQYFKTPVFGCVLIGGKSSRMGKPKHEIIENGKSWLHKIIGNLEGNVDKIVIVGAGNIEKKLLKYPRLPDVSFVDGPMSGLLAAMRWAPSASWVVVACDQPHISDDAIRWLLSNRQPGVWGIMPRIKNSKKIETMLAYYDFRSLIFTENLAFEKQFGLHKISKNSKIISPIIPDKLLNSWHNINFPESRTSEILQ